MTLVTPFLGEHPNKVIKWTNEELKSNRDSIHEGEGVKKCFRGRLYNARTAGILAIEVIINALTLPFFIVAAPFVRIPAVFCSNKQNMQDFIKKTELLSARNVILLAIRTLAVAAAVFSTFFVGVFISSNLAINIQELLGILEKKPLDQLKELIIS